MGVIDKIGRVPATVGWDLVTEYHYSKVKPRLTKVVYAGFSEGHVVAMMSLGWGVRPLHTIRRLFPGLGPKDYYEIGKLCLTDEMPRNSESEFISKVIRAVRQDFPDKKLLFTWADGMLGKPGYVYQASNFLYGGYIWTDSYFSKEGEKIHPRTSQGLEGAKEDGLICGHRPSSERQKELGLSHIKGKQFRYVYFLCDKRERRKLLSTSAFEWSRSYPKDRDLAWEVKTGDQWLPCGPPKYDPSRSEYNRAVLQRQEATPLPLFTV